MWFDGYVNEGCWLGGLVSVLRVPKNGLSSEQVWEGGESREFRWDRGFNSRGVVKIVSGWGNEGMCMGWDSKALLLTGMCIFGGWVSVS